MFFRDMEIGSYAEIIKQDTAYDGFIVYRKDKDHVYQVDPRTLEYVRDELMDMDVYWSNATKVRFQVVPWTPSYNVVTLRRLK